MALFFSCFFIIVFVLSALTRYFHIRIEAVRLLPLRPETALPEFIAAACWAAPFALYFSLLFALSFAARNRISAPVSIIFLVLLAGGFGFAVFAGMERGGFVPAVRDMGKSLGGPGLVLSQQDNTIVLIRGPAPERGPRAVSIPGRPLIYQEEPVGPDNTALALPPISFGGGTPWFLKNAAIDFSLAGERLKSRFAAGPVPFFVYLVPLVFLLVSLGFVFRPGRWPLANLLFGALVFRGILAAETFVNSPEVQNVFGSLLGNRIALPFAVPLLFTALAVLVNLYTFLVFVARKSGEED
ncbi:MAG: hypothetical protein LBG42_07290 [Treponema sp.]|nr:hypothetical protein [Treponema sp.]